jgi:phosphate-selective porin OprO/OprP
VFKFYTFLLTVLLLQSSLSAKTKKKKEPTYPKNRIGFQVIADSAWFMYNSETIDDQEIRRARVFLKGKYNKDLSYELEYSLTGGGKFKDIYLKYSALPYNTTLKVGHIKEPIGLEALTSSKYNTFMERALPDAFIADRKVGIRLSWHEMQEKYFALTTSAGIFGESINADDRKDSALSLALRTTLAFIPQKDTFWHLGLATAYGKIDDKKIKLSSRPESHMSTKYLKTKIQHADSSIRFGLEALYQQGPLSLQSEYLYEGIERTDGSTYGFSGWYAQLSYFLTDDARGYKQKEAIFSRIKPNAPIGKKSGYGAWEVATRISSLDLNDGDQIGGSAYEYTLGLNWYLTSHMRIMANYIIIDLDETDIDTPDIFQMRIQYDY